MRILISNDDGIHSEGLLALAKVLSEQHEVLVIAPADNCSAYSHKLTIHTTVKLEKWEIGNGIRAYSLTGTPADCVKFAKNVFDDFVPDVVFTGINIGENLGTDILYSGTVSAALEGAVYHHVAIALSSVPREGNDYERIARFSLGILERLLKASDRETVWNINFPMMKGVEPAYVFTKLGTQIYSDYYQPLPNGEYFLTGNPISHEENDEDCDVEWMKKGYITITPIVFDRTDYGKLEEMRKSWETL